MFCSYFAASHTLLCVFLFSDPKQPYELKSSPRNPASAFSLPHPTTQLSDTLLSTTIAVALAPKSIFIKRVENGNGSHVVI